MSNGKLLHLNWNDSRNVPGQETCKAALVDAIERVETDDFQKVLVIFLDDRDGFYKCGFQNAGMRNSEMIALMETIKSQLLDSLRGLGEPTP